MKTARFVRWMVLGSLGFLFVPSACMSDELPGSFTVEEPDASSDETPEIATCGNGWIEGGEICDRENLGGETCESIMMGSREGTLRCSSSCTFDVSGCRATIPGGMGGNGGLGGMNGGGATTGVGGLSGGGATTSN